MKHIHDKRILKNSFIIFLTTILLVIFAGCSNQAFEFYSFPFGTSDGIVTYYAVYRYTGKEENVVIPDVHNKCEVRYILDQGFSGCTLKSIDIGSVKQIYPYAFEYCSFLELVKLNNAERIFNFAFYACRRLKTITIPGSVWMIGTGAFYGCDSLESVYFESNPTDLGQGIFPENQNITIYGPSGGSLEEYAFREGITFKVWDGVS